MDDILLSIKIKYILLSKYSYVELNLPLVNFRISANPPVMSLDKQGLMMH